ncbi:MAG: FAD:protein FMN transferase [candidate division WOR-3 bacterium]|nr:FAD:protein FMN transferase [candidate division WOR-3 bacterium]
MKILKGLLLLLWFISCQKTEQEYHYQNILIGGMCEVKFYCASAKVARKIINEIDKELKYLDSLLSYFSENSLVSKINREHRAFVTPDIKPIFLMADSISRLTDGLFDISVSPLLEIWGFYKKEKRIPDKKEIEQAKNLVDYKKIKMIGDSLFIPDNMKIDLGGIAQGFAADKIADILKKHDIKSAIINIAGEVYAIGKSPKNKPWIVGIKHPRQDGVIEKVGLIDCALSTSGDYEKFFIVNGIRYPHIINPKTGYPAREFASVTIFADNTTFADGIATAVSVMGAHKGKKFLDSLGIKGIIYYEEDNRLERLESE